MPKAEMKRIELPVYVPVVVCKRCKKSADCHPMRVEAVNGRFEAVGWNIPWGWKTLRWRTDICPECVTAVEVLLARAFDDPTFTLEG